MNRMLRLFTLTAALAALASATAALALAANGGRPTVEIAKSSLGAILVDRNGRTLYDFVRDRGAMSTCYGACAALWPPLTTTAKPQAGPGARASLLGTTKRSDGRLEVTYGGHPLYYYVADSHRGQTSGQGLNQFGALWWVLSPAGNEIHRV
jgi:predicted lipoprotein with Yx(FWY)xxD motif